jgi:ABC-type transport system involved in cytochrome c biogenesis permease subunit
MAHLSFAEIAATWEVLFTALFGMTSLYIAPRAPSRAQKLGAALLYAQVATAWCTICMYLLIHLFR